MQRSGLRHGSRYTRPRRLRGMSGGGGRNGHFEELVQVDLDLYLISSGLLLREGGNGSWLQHVPSAISLMLQFSRDEKPP